MRWLRDREKVLCFFYFARALDCLYSFINMFMLSNSFQPKKKSTSIHIGNCAVEGKYRSNGKRWNSSEINWSSTNWRIPCIICFIRTKAPRKRKKQINKGNGVERRKIRRARLVVSFTVAHTQKMCMDWTCFYTFNLFVKSVENIFSMINYKNRSRYVKSILFI